MSAAVGSESRDHATAAEKRSIPGMEPRILHISEADLAKDVRSIMQRVQTGAEVVIERDAQAVAVIRPPEPREALEPPAWD